MKAAQSSLTDISLSPIPVVGKLIKTWMMWAVLSFLIASLFGVAMRYYYIGEVPFFAYKHLLHAHSHIALLGWGYLLVSGILVFSFVNIPERLTIYRRLLLLAVIAVLGMSGSFPLQGYGLYSITFSTMHLLVSYVFTYQILKDLNLVKPSLAVSLIRWGLYWMVISTMGLWAIAPVGALLGKLHPLYHLSVQWFLHLQLNGWFVYTLLGLLLHHLAVRNEAGSLLSWLHVSLLLTFALAVSWGLAHPSLYYFNAVGVVVQAIVYFKLLKPIWIDTRSASLPVWIYSLLLLALMSLASKALIQLALVLPSVSVVAYTIRMYVIGFLHLVMLGGISFGLTAIALKQTWLPSSSASKWGWMLLAVGFLGSELLLLGQGTLIWMKAGFLPQYHFLLFLTSLFFPLGLMTVFLDFTRHNALNSDIKEYTYLKTQFYFKQNAMKKSIFFSLGVLMLLMYSCGGNGENQTASNTTTVEAEKTADPKGIGPTREVNLQESIDEAMAEKGKAIMDMKCTACHQYTDKRIVGPGFEGITNRRRPEWIMNMITNVEVMLDQDPVAQALLEECLTRMPNQNISTDEARSILEHLRKNDLERTGSKDAATK